MNRKSYARTDRLRSLLLEILAEQLENIDDPQLGFAFFSAVEVDKDLNRAQVFFSSLDWGDATGDALRQAQTETAQALTQHKGSFRRAMAKQAHLRRIPELVFLPDESFQHGAHIEETLRQLNPPTNGSRSGQGFTLQTLVVTAVLVLLAAGAGVLLTAMTTAANRDLANQQPSADGPCTQVEIYDINVAAAGIKGSNAGVPGSAIGCIPACVSEWHEVDQLDADGKVLEDEHGNPKRKFRGFIMLELEVDPSRLIEVDTLAGITHKLSTVARPVHVYVGPDTFYGANGPLQIHQSDEVDYVLKVSEGEVGVRVAADQKSCEGYDRFGETIIFEQPPPASLAS